MQQSRPEQCRAGPHLKQRESILSCHDLPNDGCSIHCRLGLSCSALLLLLGCCWLTSRLLRQLEGLQTDLFVSLN